MRKFEVMQRIVSTGAMAIVRTKSISRGIEIAQGCLNGGIDILEISYTLPNAGEVIRALDQQFGDRLIVGAGTILDDVTARLAILAGAKFVIAPTFNKSVAIMCNRYQIPYAPGCTSITEMVAALEIGAAMIKAFPISNFYGSELIPVVKTPIPDMPILASGGVTLENLEEWIVQGVDAIGFGGLLTTGTVSEITENAEQIRHIIKENRK